MQCPAGFYCVEQTTDPAECPEGYYCPAGTQTAYANACPEGTFNNLTGRSALDQCIQCLPTYVFLTFLWSLSLCALAFAGPRLRLWALLGPVSPSW